jgi:hypothetical protein
MAAKATFRAYPQWQHKRDEVKSPAFSQNQIRNPTFPAKLTKKIYQTP